MFSNGYVPIGGEGGIRTLDTISRMLVFKTSAFNHSATSPYFVKHFTPKVCFHRKTFVTTSIGAIIPWCVLVSFSFLTLPLQNLSLTDNIIFSDSTLPPWIIVFFYEVHHHVHSVMSSLFNDHVHGI